MADPNNIIRLSDDMLARQRDSQLVQAADDNPDDAARADELSRATGIDSAVIYGDMDNFERRTKINLGRSIIEQDPYLQQYIASHPLAAKISGNDWGKMHEASEALQKYPGARQDSVATIGEHMAPVFKRALEEGTQAASDAYGDQYISDKSREAYPRLSALIDQFTNSPLANNWWAPFGMVVRAPRLTEAGFAGLFGGLFGGAQELAKQLGVSETGQQQLAQDLMTFIQGKGGEIPGEAPGMAEAMQVRAAQAWKIAKPFIDRGEMPPKGADPLIDRAIAVHDLLQDQNAKEAVKAVQGTNTIEQSAPFTKEHFLGKFPNPDIEIPYEAVRKLYGDKEPEPDDNLLGWVPRIAEQMENAAATGERISIPLHDWITETRERPDVVKELDGQIAWRPGAMTKEEAKEALSAADKEVIPSTIPEVDALRNTTGHASWMEDANKFEGAGPALEGEERVNLKPATAKDAQVKWASGEPLPSYTFPIEDLLDNLDSAHLVGPAKALFEFFQDRIRAGSKGVPVHVIPGDDIHALLPFANAAYLPRNNVIILPQNLVEGQGKWGINKATNVILEEASHAATAAAIERNPTIKAKIDLLRAHTQATMDPALAERFQYALSNAYEMAAWSQGHNDFQEAIAGVKLHPDIAKQLGFGPNVKTVWEAVRQIISDLIEQWTGQKPPKTVLDAMFRVGEDIEREMGRIRDPSYKATDGPLPTALANKAEEILGPKALGMTEKHFQDLLRLAQEVRAKDAAYIAERGRKDEATRQTKEWMENLEGVREEAKDTINARRDVQADVFLRTGRLGEAKYRRDRLNQALLTDEQKAGLSPEHYGEKGKIDPNTLANILGYQSKEGLINDLINMETTRRTEGLTPDAHIKQMTEVEAERMMTQRYGDLKENIADAAKDHLLVGETGDLHQEILAQSTLRYATQAGVDVPLTKEGVKKMATAAMREMTMSKLKAYRLMENVGNLGRQIEKLEAAGEWNEALRLSSQREVDFQVARLAHQRAEKMLTKWDRRAKQFSKREPKAVGIEWSNAIQDIIKRAGERVNRTTEEIQAEYEKTGEGNLQKFVESQHDENFPIDSDAPDLNHSTVTVAPFLFDPKWTGEVDKMPFSVFEAVHNSVESLYANGVNLTKFKTGQKLLDLQNMISDLVQSMEEISGGKYKQYPLNGAKAGPLQAYWASLIQMETLWNRLARGDAQNLFMQVVNAPTMEAGNFRDKLQREFSREYGKVDFKDVNGKLGETVENPFIREPLESGGYGNRPKILTKRNLLAVVSNLGNWSNASKLLGGYDIPTKMIDEWRKSGYKMSMNDPFMNWVFSVTDKSWWDRAQKIGDIFEKLFDRSEDTYYDMGARPGPRIELQPIETPWGTYKGWYHPIIRDSARPAFITEEGKVVGGSKKLIGADPYEDGGFYQPAPSAGYQKARTGYQAPLELGFDAVPFRMKQIINDIAMKPVVKELSKVFGDPKFRNALTRNMGVEYTSLLNPYLKDIAGQRRYIDPLSSLGGHVADYLLQNLITTVVGFNPGIVLKHFPTALNTSVAEVGAQDFFKEFANTWFNPFSGWANVRFAREASDEIARRSRNWRETISGVQEDLFGGGTTSPFSVALPEKAANMLEKWRQQYIKIAATPVAWSDMASVVPMWLTVYKREMRANPDDMGAAVAAADLAVRRAHGSTAVTARPQIMRSSNPFVRATIPFYTFFNDILQRQYETAWRAKEGARYATNPDYIAGKGQLPKVMMGLWAYFIFPALVEQAISPIQFDEDDGYGKMVAEILARDLTSSWPYMRDVVGHFTQGTTTTGVGIFGEAYQGFTNFADDLLKEDASLSEERGGKLIKDTAVLMGIMLGIGGVQPGRWGQGAFNYATGAEEPDELGEWYRDMRFGTVKEPRKRR